MKNKIMKRRTVLKSVMLSGAGLSVLPESWKKPIVNSVLLPAHAQTSAVIIECPMLVIGNGSFSAGSAPGTCGLSFEILSGDAAVPVDILSVSTSGLIGTDAVSFSGGTVGSVTAASGLSVQWVGQAVGAPFACVADVPVPINEVTFIVTYNCAENAIIQTVSFSLQEIAASL